MEIKPQAASHNIKYTVQSSIQYRMTVKPALHEYHTRKMAFLPTRLSNYLNTQVTLVCTVRGRSKYVTTA